MAGPTSNRLVLASLRLLVRVAALFAILVAIAWVVAWLVLCQPVFSTNPRSATKVDPAGLERHVRMLSEELSPRSYVNAPNLDRCAEYVASEFQKRGATVEIQEYSLGGRRFRNVIGRFGDGRDGLWVVGAHYDAFGETPGADDNASGVAGLIELAGLLGTVQTPPEVELVAYCLEEPPFFRSPYMGSAIHAWQLHEQRVDVRGVVVLEMIGYFDDAWMSQDYPISLLRALYPSRGNFIGLVGQLDQRTFVRDFKRRMKGLTDLPVHSINAPLRLAAINLSDHTNYWQYGWPALMVTDTAFYRNEAYHTDGDTWDRLDYRRMADVVTMVFGALVSDKPVRR